MITVEHLSVRKAKRLILDDVSFSLSEGDFLAVLGPNGGGKSTLVRSLLGLDPFDGSISYGVDKIPDIGYVPQVKTLDRTFPARAKELVATALIKKWPWSIDDACLKVVTEAMVLVGAAHLADQQIGSLSGGELQRIYLARAIIGSPSLLILDEPSAGVDQTGTADLLEIVESYRKLNDTIVIMVTHDWEVAFHHASHVLLLKTRQISFGPVDSALTENAIRQAFGHVGHSHEVLGGAHSHA